MPLSRARCAQCSEPLADPPFAALPVRCAYCGFGRNVEVAADGQPTGFDTLFLVPRLLAWFAAARDRMARGTLGVCVGGCNRCRAPLLVAPGDPVTLPCPHCQSTVAGEAADVLTDQWTEPWTKVEGADLSLEYRLALVDDKGIGCGCAACGLPTPPTDPSSRCARCGAVTWTLGRSGQRTQLGVRVDGTRGGKPWHALVPIMQGEAMLRADAARGASSRAGQSLLSATGVGCAVAAGLALLVVCATVVAVVLTK